MSLAPDRWPCSLTRDAPLTENANGSELHGVLEERNLYAVSTFMPNYQATRWSGRAQHHGRRVDYIAVSDGWRDLSAKPLTMLAIQLSGEATDHVFVRTSMLWPHFCTDGAKHDVVGNATLVVDPRLPSNAEAQRWFQHYTSACIPKLFSLAQRGLNDDMYSTAHSTLHQCASVLVCRSQLPSQTNCGRVDELRRWASGQALLDTSCTKHRLTLKRADKKTCSGGLDELRRSIRCGWCTRSNKRTLPAKRCGGMRAPHAEGPKDSHEAGYHA